MGRREIVEIRTFFEKMPHLAYFNSRFRDSIREASAKLKSDRRVYYKKRYAFKLLLRFLIFWHFPHILFYERS